jgi:hypothetical protein
MRLRTIVIALFGLTPLVAQAGQTLSSTSEDFAARARAVPIGETLVVEGLALELGKPAEPLELTRYEAWTPDARIEIVASDASTFVDPPASVRFLGRVAGRRGSQVVLTVRESGEVRGLVTEPGRGWVVSTNEAGRFAALEVELAASPEQAFACGTDELEAVTDLFGVEEGASHAAALLGTSPVYRVDVAIETDQEYLGLFGGNTTNAADYAADILAFATIAYDRDVGARLAIPYLRLWTSTDPWTQTNPQCAMFQLGKYWNDNMSGISRSLTHLFSGKSTNAGIAWVGVICSGGFTYNSGGCGLTPQTSNYGGHYGVSSGLDGNFNPTTPATLWDTVVVAHEIGHNFNSPHSHCYANIGGNTSPIDTCYNGQCGQSGCHCGSTSLPSGCAGSGQACGTVMSYCHLLSGGMGNIAQSFGPGHPYGIVPTRQAARMRAHVEANAGCLSLAAFFTDGFESGNANAWSQTVP